MLFAFFEWLEASALGVFVKDRAATFAIIEAVHLMGLALLGGTVLAHPRYADLPPANGWALRPARRRSDLSSASPTAPLRPGDTTPQVMRSTGGKSHAGPGGQRSSCRTAKKHNGAGRRTDPAFSPDPAIPGPARSPPNHKEFRTPAGF